MKPLDRGFNAVEFVGIMDGISDGHALSTVGINPVHLLSSVGQKLIEQTSEVIQWSVNDTNTFERFTRNAALMAELLEDWKVTKSGPLKTPMPTRSGLHSKR
ncbi:hypothetical protein EYR40_008413 [Pleurotus pulmonarius]|nr:hypothetical protein EYR40_008413 [Pleurotus pulmonarius]